MATPTYPGVYVEEVSSGVRPISVASTSTAAFIGQAERGSISDAVRIFNFTEFQNLYGGFLSSSYLAHSVFQFFNNGGSICYIVRVTGGNTQTASAELSDRASPGQHTLTVSASSPGEWGNNIQIEVADGTNDPGNEFNLSVYREGEEAPLERFENLGMIPGAANFVETATATSRYIHVEVNDASPTLTSDAARGSSRGAEPPVVPLAAPETRMRINVNGDGYQEVNLTDGVGGESDQVDNLDTAANVAGAIQYVVRQLAPSHGSTDPAAFSAFEASVDGGTGVLVLHSGAPGASSSVSIAPASDADQDVTGYLSLGRLRSGREAFGAAVTRPPVNTPSVPFYLLGDHSPVAPTGPVISVELGSDGDPVTTDQPYIDALSRLDDKDDVSLIAVPGIGSPTVFGEATNYCEQRPLSDCFFVGDMPQDVDTVSEAQSFVDGISPKNSYGAVYMPWINTLDPTGNSEDPIAVPASGYVLGLYAKTDARRGVWKAPAGTAAAIAGSTGLSARLTDIQQGLLNQSPYNVNVIREFAAAGRVLWGSRTITSDPEWRYIPIRRTAIMLRVSLYRGIQWAVFEPNDEPLWTQLHLNITSFMTGLFRRGAFQGSTPSQAFFVKVDSETTTQNDINNGIVNIEVGFAPLRPAEFVVVKLSQKAGQSG